MSRNPLQNFVVRFTPRETVFSEGDVGATMFIVQSGRVRLFKNLEDQERELGVMEKGDFFGEMSILEGLPRTSSAQALDASELIEINGMTFDKMIRANIEIAVRLLRKLSMRLREAERKNAELQPNGARPISTAVETSSPSSTVGEVAAEGVRLESEDGVVLFSIGPSETLLGRYDPVTELRPDIDLTEVDLKRSVSRRHARIVSMDGGYSLIEESGALNGTFVNGTQLTTGQAHPLNDGDEVGLGMVKLQFRI
jgi:CRP-like cAMP-binding protein